MLPQIDHASGIFQTDEYDTAKQAQLRRCFQRREPEGTAIAFQKLHQFLEALGWKIVRSVLYFFMRRS